MSVAIRDLRNVIRAARRGGRTVVLGGHSLGGTITVAYATWDFGGRAGAEDLVGPRADRRRQRRGAGLRAPRRAQQLAASSTASSPFLDLTGLGLPWSAGVFNIVGSTLARHGPGRARRAAATGRCCPPTSRPPVPATNAGRLRLRVRQRHLAGQPAARAHAHRRARAGGRPAPWVDGELGTVRRAAVMFSGIEGIDGTAWYHPRRLSLDGAAVAGGLRQPARSACSACAPPTAATSTCRSTRSRPRSAPAACWPAPGRSPAARASRAAALCSSTATDLRPRRPALRRAAPERLRAHRGAVPAPGRVRPLHRGVSSSRRNGRSPRAR